jgi:tRNA(Ile)-lysidine synthase TilS/MesJ
MGPAGGGMPGDPSASRNEFDAIRQRLRQVLKEVEEQEHQPLGPQAPQTLAEVDKLQEKLREALSELDRRKTELTKEK